MKAAQSAPPVVDELEESDQEVEDSVAEDMRRLEESFEGISERFRLINRIGEGMLLASHMSAQRGSNKR